MAYSNKAVYRRWYERNKEKVRAQKKDVMRKLRAAQPERYREQSRNAKKSLRGKIFEIYGSTCRSCGFSDKRALTLDHILNNGAEERKAIGERGVYRRAIEQENHSEYQVLCMNCQFIKRVESQRENQNT